MVIGEKLHFSSYPTYFLAVTGMTAHDGKSIHLKLQIRMLSIQVLEPADH
jgi:hypothetical protein